MVRKVPFLVFFLGMYVASYLYIKNYFKVNYSKYCQEMPKDPTKIVNQIHNKLFEKLQNSNAAVLSVSEQELTAILQDLNKSGDTYYNGCFKITNRKIYLFWFNKLLWGMLEIKLKQSRPYFFVSKLKIFGISLPNCCVEKINKYILSEYEDYFYKTKLTLFEIEYIDVNDSSIRIYIQKE